MLDIRPRDILKYVYNTYLETYIFFRAIRTFYLFPFVAVKKAREAVHNEYIKSVGVHLAAKRFNLINDSDYIASRSNGCIKLAESREVEVTAPKFFSDRDYKPIMESLRTRRIPALTCFEVRDVGLIGSTNFLVFDSKVAPTPSFVAKRDLSWIELHHWAILDVDSLIIKIYGANRPTRTVHEAINLLGQCSGNYAHFLTEILPRLIVCDRAGVDPKIPILLDGWIDPIFQEVLQVFNIHERPIIRVGMFEHIFVERLFQTSEVGYVPAGDRYFLQTKKLPYPRGDMFVFSDVALELLRKDGAVQTSSRDKNRIGKYNNRPLIYLKRNSQSWNRRVPCNQDKIIENLERLGFLTVDPAKLSFSEQMMLFQQARVIVSPIGAALASTVFSPRACKIIALSPYYENANYYYFANLMNSLGHDLQYVLGEQIAKGPERNLLNRDYVIDITLLGRVLNETI
jgi:capsular polysaccharide biosynthesis protein